MQAKKITVGKLTTSEILSILEIFEGYYGVRPNWNLLKKRLASQSSWLLMDGEHVVGCAQFVNARALIRGAVLLTEFVYRWEYNTEAYIHQMLQAIIDACPPNTSCLLLDISRKHECNYTYYRHLGFQDSLFRSPIDKENMVLIKELDGKE